MVLAVTERSERLLNISEVACRLAVHQHALREWADGGRVKHVKLLSGVRRFDAAEMGRKRREMGYSD